MSEEDADKLVGRKIQSLREQLGILQGELSGQLRAAGVNWSQGTLSKVELGARPVRLSEAPIVAEILRVDVTDLLPTTSFLATDLIRFRWSEQTARESMEHSQFVYEEIRNFRQRVQLLSHLSQGLKGPYIVHLSAAAFLSGCHDDPVTGGLWHTEREVLGALGIPSGVIDEAKEKALDLTALWEKGEHGLSALRELLSADMLIPFEHLDERGIDLDTWNPVVATSLIQQEYGKLLASTFPQVTFSTIESHQDGTLVEGLDESEAPSRDWPSE